MTLCSTKDCTEKAVYTTLGMCRMHRNHYYARNNRSRRTQYHREYRAKLKNSVFEHYGNICNCCGETEFLFLSIDHVNNDGNTHIGKSGARVTSGYLYSQIITAGYQDTYQLLCMNCNFGKRMNNDICPHKQVGV